MFSCKVIEGNTQCLMQRRSIFMFHSLNVSFCDVLLLHQLFSFLFILGQFGPQRFESENQVADCIVAVLDGVRMLVQNTEDCANVEFGCCQLTSVGGCLFFKLKSAHGVLQGHFGLLCFLIEAP